MPYLSVTVEFADIPRNNTIVAWCRATDQEGNLVQAELFGATPSHSYQLAVQVENWIGAACTAVLS